MKKPILCLDFDGVIHSYSSGWQGVGVANDPPVEGAVDFLHSATENFSVHIFSSRSKSLRGRACMKRYMRQHFRIPLTFSPFHKEDWLHEELYYPWFKPPSLVSLDDRGMTFTGTWPGMDDLLNFKPWNRKASPNDRD